MFQMSVSSSRVSLGMVLGALSMCLIALSSIACILLISVLFGIHTSAAYVSMGMMQVLISIHIISIWMNAIEVVTSCYV